MPQVRVSPIAVARAVTVMVWISVVGVWPFTVVANVPGLRLRTSLIVGATSAVESAVSAMIA